MPYTNLHGKPLVEMFGRCENEHVYFGPFSEKSDDIIPEEFFLDCVTVKGRPPGQHNNNIYTGPYFGCIHHQSKWSN